MGGTGGDGFSSSSSSDFSTSMYGGYDATAAALGDPSDWGGAPAADEFYSGLNPTATPQPQAYTSQNINYDGSIPEMYSEDGLMSQLYGVNTPQTVIQGIMDNPDLYASNIKTPEFDILGFEIPSFDTGINKYEIPEDFFNSGISKIAGLGIPDLLSKFLGPLESQIGGQLGAKYAPEILQSFVPMTAGVTAWNEAPGLLAELGLINNPAEAESYLNEAGVWGLGDNDYTLEGIHKAEGGVDGSPSSPSLISNLTGAGSSLADMTMDDAGLGSMSGTAAGVPTQKREVTSSSGISGLTPESPSLRRVMAKIKAAMEAKESKNNLEYLTGVDTSLA